jgi:hypothetical protein
MNSTMDRVTNVASKLCTIIGKCETEENLPASTTFYTRIINICICGAAILFKEDALTQKRVKKF